MTNLKRRDDGEDVVDICDEQALNCVDGFFYSGVEGSEDCEQEDAEPDVFDGSEETA